MAMPNRLSPWSDLLHSDLLSLDAEKQEVVRMQELIADISGILVNLSAEEIDGQIVTALKRIVEFLGIDRSGFGEFSREEAELIITHTYAIPGVDPNVPIWITRVLPWLSERLSRGEIVVIENVEDLPPEAIEEKKYVLKSGLKSSVLIPFSIGGSMLCAIGFTSFHKSRKWSAPLVDQLKRVGEGLAHAVYRKRAEEKILSQLNKLEKAYKEIKDLKNRLEAEAEYLRSEIKLNYRY